MLSKRDKEWLAQMMDEKIRKALTVKVRFERRRDIKTGQPLAVPEVEVTDVYLPDHWVEFLPYYEGAIRGVQETTDHVKNSVGPQMELISNMAKVLIDAKKALDVIVGIASDDKVIEITNRKALGGG